jgi:MinD superfamily P-loop ATPase
MSAPLEGLTLAVASGKGGTGKTTVAVALALSAPGLVQILDCDVDEPNTGIFLEGRMRESVSVGLPVPQVDQDRCTACGACSRACQFGAIVSLKTTPLVFPELCHGCGACALACPVDAIEEVDRPIGRISAGQIDRAGLPPLQYVEGRLNVGHPMAPPVIRAVKARFCEGALRIVDCPPGTACPVVTAVRGSDFVLLVTEPTPFGLNDLKLAVETMRVVGLPFGVLVNRDEAADRRVDDYCRAEGLPIMLRIPDDRRIAEAYSRGVPLTAALPEVRGELVGLLADIGRRVAERQSPATHQPGEGP